MMQTDAREPVVDPAEDVAIVEADIVPETPVVRTGARRSGLIGSILGGFLAALAGFLLAQYVPNGWPFAVTSNLEAQIAAQNQHLESLQNQMANLPKTIPADPTLQQRLTALEAIPKTDIGRIDDRLAALESRLTAMEPLPADAPGATSAAITALQTQVQALRDTGVAKDSEAIAATTAAQLKEAQVAAAAITENAEKLAKSTRQQAALGQLRLAMDSGASFAGALTDLGVESSNVPAVLTDNAENGLPTLSALKAVYPPAARLALDAALRVGMGQSWSERASTFLRSQTGARSLEPRAGTDPDAILSRAEAALNTADLKTALAELTTLPPEAQAPLSEWQALAETRLAAEQAIAALAASIGK